MKKIRNINKITLVSTIIFFIVFSLNLLTIKVADDYGYSISSGIVDIFNKEFVQYFTWNGRSVAHIIARIFLSLPKIIFDIANSFVFVYMLNLMYRLITKEKNNFMLFIMVALSVFLFVPFFGQTILWETGSCNYLWMTTIILQFLYFYRYDVQVNGILLFLLGICAGWSNENTGGACILIALSLMIMHYVQKRKISYHLLFGILGAMIGFAALVLAPGNAMRALEFVNDNSKLYSFVHDFTSTVRVIKEGMGYFLIAYIFLLLILWKQKGSYLVVASIFMLAAIADVGAIVLSPVPVLWDRSMFGAAVLAIISLGILIVNLDMKILLNQYVFNAVLAIMVVISGIRLTHAYFDIGYIFVQNYQRNAYIKQQKANGNLDPIIFQFDSEFISPYNAVYGLNDITPYYSFWYNEDFAKVNGLNTIQATNKSKWKLIYQNGDIALMSIANLQEYVDYILANKDQYLIFVNSSTLDKRYEDYLPQIKRLDVDVSKSNFAAVIDNGMIVNECASNEGCEIYGNFNEKEYYLASYNAGNISDIVIDDVEYTNNHAGINIVVFDKQAYRVVDSISFVLDYNLQGIRYEVE
ncbi:MAG: DUF6056 family protein [Erysipelotrichaceae bacterium]|nr:DUF6056 family protein [Erysipelotrichaceae bacterium]MDY5252435.1 DUF6056 family protein [Erysipelotrichaceae bacterium]